MSDLGSALAELVRSAVRAELAELVVPTTAPAEVLDVAGLCALLHVSRATVHRLRADGMPTLMVGDSPRFERAAVLAWLRGRSR